MAARQRIFNEKPERPARSAATSQPSSSRRRAAAKPSSKPGSNAQSNSTQASTAAQWQRAVPSPAAFAEAQRAAEAEKRAEKDRAAEALAAREKALVKAAIQAAAARERERAAEEAQSAVVSITEGSILTQQRLVNDGAICVLSLPLVITWFGASLPILLPCSPHTHSFWLTPFLHLACSRTVQCPSTAATTTLQAQGHLRRGRCSKLGPQSLRRGASLT